MQVELVHDIKVNLTFTKEELEYLLTLSHNHYDQKCKAASMTSGFLSNMKVIQALSDDGSSWLMLDGNELGTLAKITELESYLPSDKGISLRERIMNVLHQREAEWKRVTASD